MEQVRCLIVSQKNSLLSDIVHWLMSENQAINIIGHVTNYNDVARAAFDSRAEVVIMDLHNNTVPAIVCELVESISGLIVIGLLDNTGQAVVVFGDVSPKLVVELACMAKSSA